MQEPFTVDHWRQLPEGFPAQLVDGSLVCEPAPSFGHQRIVGRVYRRLVEIVGEDRVALAPSDVVIDRCNVLQPDVCVLRRTPPSESSDVGIPLLAVEVLSPSTRSRDRSIKAGKLIAAGVAEVWLLDAEAGVIEVRSAGSSDRFRDAEIATSREVPGFSLEPNEVL